jgi:NAD(P)-dependent dehydrogenase (short-subunit alcohol dehydrogenase family)
MKHVIIVGGTKGLGKELAAQFSRNETRVSVFGRTPPVELESIVDYFPVDLADRAATKTVFESSVATNGPLDSLICCQRFRGQGDPWAGELDVGLTATKDLIEAASQRFSPTGSRSIVLVASVAGVWIAAEQGVGYHVAKAGLETLIRYYAVKLGPLGVRINGVSPSAFIKAESKNYHETHPEISARMAALTPLRRMGTAAETADAIIFLAGDRARFITGQNLIVDGGLTLQLQTSLG